MHHLRSFSPHLRLTLLRISLDSPATPLQAAVITLQATVAMVVAAMDVVNNASHVAKYAAVSTMLISVICILAVPLPLRLT